jgi:hypothetical protein
MTIAVAWIFYRPLLAIALLAAVGCALYGIWYLIGKFRNQRLTAAAKPA